MTAADPVAEATPAELERYAELQALALDFARAGESDELARMLAAGLPVNLRDHKGNSLLMLASYHGHAAATRLLLDHGADPEGRNDRGQTPLGGVAFKGDSELVTLLLDRGADVNADQGGRKAPLMFATLFGRFAVRRLLKSRGARLWTPRNST